VSRDKQAPRPQSWGQADGGSSSVEDAGEKKGKSGDIVQLVWSHVHFHRGGSQPPAWFQTAEQNTVRETWRVRTLDAKLWDPVHCKLE
jgi:hypothetical protein